MSNSLVIQEETKAVAFTTEQAKTAYLTPNTNPSLSYNFWSFDDVKDDDVTAKIARAEAKLKKAETEEDAFEAITELRKYRRINLIFKRFAKVSVENPADGTTAIRDAVVFYDPYSNEEITMKQTIAVSILQSLNDLVGQEQDGDEWDGTKNYLKGAMLDLTYKGRQKNATNSRHSDQFDVRPSTTIQN